MCGRCEGEPYRGVKALFNGDLHAGSDLIDRAEWIVLSPNVLIYLGNTALKGQSRPLLRICDNGIEMIGADEHAALKIKSEKLERPIYGKP